MAPRQRSSRSRADVAIAFHEVSRRFLLRHEQRLSFQDWFVGLLRPRGKAEEFWALRDVTFSVGWGEAVGILGRNGAGKSTLLKLLTRILTPTTGEVVTNGRTHAMLELGAGFHPELSGRDNVFLNGSIYGLSRREMAERFDRIVRFAELERFIDTPVKHYSSGMFMRLGFSIAIHMDPEILVIDEVMAVGDAAFQEKSYRALEALKERGTTILFVSHNAEQIRSFCDRAVLLQQGRMIDVGPASDVVDHYLRLLQGERVNAMIVAARPTDAAGRPDAAVVPGDDLGFKILLQLPADGSPAAFAVGLDLYDDETHLFSTSQALPDDLAPLDSSDDRLFPATALIRGLPVAHGPLTAVVTLHRADDRSAVLDRREMRVDLVTDPRPTDGLLQLDHDWQWGSGPSAGADGVTRTGARRDSADDNAPPDRIRR